MDLNVSRSGAGGNSRHRSAGNSASAQKHLERAKPRRTGSGNESVKRKMKTIIQNSKTNTAAVKFVAGAIGRRNTLPILANVLCTANSRFEMTATDLDVTLQAACDCQTAQDGETTIPGRALLEAVGGKPARLRWNWKRTKNKSRHSAWGEINAVFTAWRRRNSRRLSSCRRTRASCHFLPIYLWQL